MGMGQRLALVVAGATLAVIAACVGDEPENGTEPTKDSDDAGAFDASTTTITDAGSNADVVESDAADASACELFESFDAVSGDPLAEWPHSDIGDAGAGLSATTDGAKSPPRSLQVKLGAVPSGVRETFAVREVCAVVPRLLTIDFDLDIAQRVSGGTPAVFFRIDGMTTDPIYFIDHDSTGAQLVYPDGNDIAASALFPPADFARATWHHIHVEIERLPDNKLGVRTRIDSTTKDGPIATLEENPHQAIQLELGLRTSGNSGAHDVRFDNVHVTGSL